MTNGNEDTVRELLAELGEAPGMQFDAGFADRVMGRLSASPAQDDISSALARQARRVIPALLAASLALVAWNWKTTHDSADSALFAALGVRASLTTSSSSSAMALEGAEAFQ